MKQANNINAIAVPVLC